MTTLWDTTGSDVVKALAAERRTAGAVAAGLALTLVVVVEESEVEAVEKAATVAAAHHPCRLLVVVRRRPDAPEPRLDAEVLIGGRLGPGEAVVMRMYGRLALHAESVVLPLLAPDAPVVTWVHGAPPESLTNDPLAVLANRRVTDTAAAADPLAALQQRADDYAPGDTDLAWTRTTGWRSLLAAVFDTRPQGVRSGRVEAEAGNPSAPLLAGWLRARLGVSVEVVTSDGPGITAVVLDTSGDDGPSEVAVTRTDGRSAVVRQRDGEHAMPLPRRDLGDLLAEELRRLDADQPYAEALQAWSGTTGLGERAASRRHVWVEPAP